MDMEIKKTLLLEDIKGNREVAYSLLEAKHSLFIDCKIITSNEELDLESNLPDDSYCWDNLMEMTKEEKLRHLINVGVLYDELKNSKYTYELNPDNLTFTVNGLVQLKYRGIKNQVPPYENISKEIFLNSYQSMIISLLDKKIDYDSLVNGKLHFYKGDLFCESVIKAESIDEVLNLLQETYLKEKENNKQRYTRVKKNLLSRMKTSTIISSLVAVCSIVGIAYLLLFTLPRETNISTIRLAFIQQDYSKVITTIKNENSKSLSRDDKYIVAYSVIMTEPLTEEQKKELSRISTQSNEEYLRYWVLIGQAKIDDAIDIASFLDDPQLLMYGMTKKIDEIQRNPNLKSEERTQKINDYKSKLEELKKKYLTPSDENTNKNNKPSNDKQK